MHDCSGLGPNGGASPRRWARLLRDEGYVVVIPDSFTTRGFPDGVCTDPSPRRQEVAPSRRVADVAEALAYARSMPFVDGKRIAIMGGSHGGATTIATMNSPQGSNFRAAIALYPGCGARHGDWRPGQVYVPAAPLLILSGELDDWTPAEPCRRLADDARNAGHPVQIKVYPGAHHSFDGPAPLRHVPTRVNANAPGGRGATTGGNADAWADSIKEVRAFLARHL
jgi:dienelactone hydrolase